MYVIVHYFTPRNEPDNIDNSQSVIRLVNKRIYFENFIFYYFFRLDLYLQLFLIYVLYHLLLLLLEIMIEMNFLNGKFFFIEKIFHFVLIFNRLFGAFPAARLPLKIYSTFDCVARINTVLSVDNSFAFKNKIKLTSI